MSNTFTISALSGGQGKTTVAFFLSLLLTRQNYKTLVIDLDPQANLTFWLNHSVDPYEPTALEMITGTINARECIYQSFQYPGLHLIPSDNGLSKSEQYLAISGLGAMVLTNRLQSLKPEFDFIIVDSPPSRSQLALTAIGACDYLIIPAETHAKGVNSLIRTLELFNSLKEMNPVFQPSVLGFIPFRDRWIGYNQQQKSREAIKLMSEIAFQQKTQIFPSILESERFKQALDTGTSLKDLGYPDLEYPFEAVLTSVGVNPDRDLNQVVNNLGGASNAG